MYDSSAQTLVFLTFLLLAVGCTFAEAFWLSKRASASFGKGFIIAAVSNFIGFFASFIVISLSLGIFAMIMFDGTVDSTAGGIGAVSLLIFIIAFMPLLLIFCKRVLVFLLKVQTGIWAWVYSLVSSILFLLIALGIPVLIEYLLTLWDSRRFR